MSLEKLVPVVKLTDMSDDMQKEVIEVARVAIERSSTVKSILFYLQRTNKLLLTSKMISDQDIMEPGTVLQEEILAHMSLMKPSITYTFILAKQQLCSLKQDD